MKILNTIKVASTTLVVAVSLNMTGFTYAVSSTASHNIKDYKVVAHSGKVKRSQILVAIRAGFPGVRPSVIAKPSPMYPNCYTARFNYKGELKRVTFNCTQGNIELTMNTR